MEAISARGGKARMEKKKKERKKEETRVSSISKTTRRIFEGMVSRKMKWPGIVEKPGSQKTTGKKSQLSEIAAKAREPEAIQERQRERDLPRIFPSRQEKDTTPPLNVLNSKIPLSCTRARLKKKKKKKKKKN